jgi:hypothetical protein
MVIGKGSRAAIEESVYRDSQTMATGSDIDNDNNGMEALAKFQ